MWFKVQDDEQTDKIDDLGDDKDNGNGDDDDWFSSSFSSLN